jgi:ubiquinone/menaquinone biosynthesis C-methylase UbiE
LPFRDSCFDSALIVMGLHHLPNPYNGIEELSRVSNRFVVIIDLIEPLTTRILKRLPFLFLGKEWCGAEPNRLSVERATSTLQSKGLCIKKAVTYFSHFPALLKPISSGKMPRILFDLQQKILKRFYCLVPVLCNELIVVAERARNA